MSLPDSPTAAAASAAEGAAGRPAGIDPRGPRFTAAVTATLLLVTAALGFGGAAEAAWWLLAAISAVFLWSAIAGVARNPIGVFFRRVVRPRLAPPAGLEDPRPPTFAQAVGFIVTVVGVVLGAFGVATAVPVAAALAFVAAFLNAAFGYCLGCQIYLLLVRARLIRTA